MLRQELNRIQLGGAVAESGRQQTSFFWYVSGMGAVAFLVSLMLHRRGKGLKLYYTTG
ncbi:hypothetical protein [Candidatus Erwinia dacicola]|uniref:hypothetical protein n=1 Tax=Candidatus Erwinia dacicola TaxID=252393 RepID=UPI00164C14DC|nr:hypothetical protein [Candidatus Erwinia dacicola]